MQPKKKYTADTAPAPFVTTETKPRLVILNVYLSNVPLRAQIYAEDYNALIRAGVSPLWQVLRGKDGVEYVRACKFGQKVPVMIAREIIGATPEDPIRYWNRDHLDLRRKNLSIGKPFDAPGLFEPEPLEGWLA